MGLLTSLFGCSWKSLYLTSQETVKIQAETIALKDEVIDLQKKQIADLKALIESLCEQLAHKDHQWDDMRHKRDTLKTELFDLRGEFAKCNWAEDAEGGH